MNAYAGEYVYIDLTSKKIERRPFDESLLRKFVGGMGVNLKLMQENYEADVNEFSPDNPIILGTGPLVDTPAPSSPKTFTTTKYPLNHCIGTGVGGMKFSRELKRAGFDHVVIKGESEKPIYLYANNGTVEIRDATDLWGLDIYETTKTLQRELGTDHSVIAIGPAGENLVKISLALIDNIASLGKGGLGAVFGSKNLKAIVTHGDKKPTIAHPDEFMEVARSVGSAMKNSPRRETLMKLGSMAGWQHWSEVVGIPYRDWTEIYPREQLRKNFGPEAYLEQVNTTRIACPTCLLPCKERFKFVNEDNDEAVTFASSFIGRVTAFGARCDVGTIQGALICHDLCARLGLDTYGVGNSIDYLITLYEDGLITREDTGGLALKRDLETTKQLIRQIAFRQGVGSILADGFEHLGEHFGREFDSNIKGMDFIFDARGYRLGTYEFEQVVNPRGGHQHAGGSPTYGAREVPLETIKDYCRAMAVPESAMEKIFYLDRDFNVARLTKHCEDWYAVYSALGICSRKTIKAFYTMDTFSSLYSSATGWEMTNEALKEAGERAWNLLKLLNISEGFTRERDQFPASWFKPLKDGDKELVLMDYYDTKELSHDDLNNLLDDYYDEHGWCVVHGIPTQKTAKTLGLEGEVEALKNDYYEPSGSCHV